MASKSLIDQALAIIAASDGEVSIAQLNELLDPPPIDRPLTIGEVATLLGLGAHTIRYYEREGLIDIPRDSAGNRAVDEAAIRRLIFLTRMRVSGMPMADLKHFAKLVDEGNGTVPERLEMLVEHRDTLERQLAELRFSLAVTEYKIAMYQDGIDS